jgi:isopenicillin-N epimerase
MSAEFDLVGTRDPSPWLAAPDGIAFMQELGLDAMRAWNHQLAYGSARTFAQRWSVQVPAPERMYGSMVTIPLPERFGATREAAQTLKDVLLYDERIESQLHPFAGRLWIRLAAQVYNDGSDFERLFAAIEKRG